MLDKFHILIKILNKGEGTLKMLLSQLHDMIKHNYEHGLYSQGYTSKSNDSNPSKIKDLKNLSDFQMGKH